MHQRYIYFNANKLIIIVLYFCQNIFLRIHEIRDKYAHFSSTIIQTQLKRSRQVSSFRHDGSKHQLTDINGKYKYYICNAAAASCGGNSWWRRILYNVFMMSLTKMMMVLENLSVMTSRGLRRAIWKKFTTIFSRDIGQMYPNKGVSH